MSETELKKEVNVKELLEEIITNPDKYNKEAKLILVLTTSSYASGWYKDIEDIEVVDGDAEIVTLSRRTDYDRTTERIAIIPKSVPTVIKFEKSCNYCDDGHQVKYYVFTGREWISVDVENIP